MTHEQFKAIQAERWWWLNFAATRNILAHTIQVEQERMAYLTKPVYGIKRPIIDRDPGDES
jgi:hypothetical protein